MVVLLQTTTICCMLKLFPYSIYDRRTSVYLGIRRVRWDRRSNLPALNVQNGHRIPAGRYSRHYPSLHIQKPATMTKKSKFNQRLLCVKFSLRICNVKLWWIGGQLWSCLSPGKNLTLKTVDKSICVHLLFAFNLGHNYIIRI